MQKTRYGYGAAAVVAAALALSACSGTGTDTQSAATSSPTAVATATAEAGSESHNDSDVAFAQGMIPHHHQAIMMSDTLLAKPGIQPDVVSLATDIKNTQAPEIDQMRGWLQQWGAGNTMPGHGMPGHQMPAQDMPGMGGMPAMGQMPGMMSPADMAALQNAQGADASRLFLTQMIVHHEGAITMSQTELDNGQYPATLELARAIITAQQEEITKMRQMLDAM